MARTPILLALALLAPAAFAPASGDAANPVPAVAEGYALAPLASVAVPTSIAWGPGDDGPDLYATTLAGAVVRVQLLWTPAGPVAQGQETVATGFSQPLGLAFDGAVLYVSDSGPGAESGRTDGRVWRVDGTDRRLVVDGLPNDRHNANNLRFGPDGRLHVANGNPNDNGRDGGAADVFPYSGAILSFDAAAVSASPAVLHWKDESGARIAPSAIAAHPRNADFAAKVRVLASGFRNVYDVAFDAEGRAYTATNGADDPSSQDLFYRIEPGTDYGFPFCYNVGPAGGVALRGEVAVAPNPVFDDPARCAAVPPAEALLGWHVCATGLDVAPPGSPFGRAAFVAECGPFFVEDMVAQSRADPANATHNAGHKIARVALDADGRALEVRDFVTGLALPTDVLFGPDGALYVADAEAILRVSALPRAATPIVAGPGAFLTTYATPVAVAEAGAAPTFLNADVPPHNVVSVDLDAYGQPLFMTPLVGPGQSATVPAQDLPPGEYAFYCALHPRMTGTLVVR